MEKKFEVEMKEVMLDNELVEEDLDKMEFELEEVEGFDVALLQGCGDIDYSS